MLADGPGWRWIFFINIPIGIVLVIAARRYLPNDRVTTIGAQLDFAGTAAATLGTLALVFAAAQSAIHGAADARTLLSLAFAVVCFVGFAVQETPGTLRGARAT